MRYKTLITDIVCIVLGLGIMLMGMKLVHSFTESYTASFINVMPMTLGLWFISNTLRIGRLIGRKALLLFFVFIILYTELSIIFGINFVLDSFLNGGGDVCAHDEQTWHYNSAIAIAGFSSNDWANDALQGLYLGKYQNLLVYLSLLFKFGGNIPTNMIVWNAFHVFLSAILIVKVSENFGVVEQKRFVLIFAICLLQPYLDAIVAFHRDGYGEVSLLLGLYIFSATYKNSVSNIIAFPIYAFLFWSFRAQYALIVAALYMWSVFQGNRKRINIVVGITMTMLVVIFFITRMNVYDYVYSDMYVGGYEKTTEIRFAGRGFINMLLISILGYFPWTNLFKDILWPWNLFACFQGAMNVAVFYYVIKIYRKKLGSLFTNPLLCTGLLLVVASVYVPGHMSYTVVPMPLLAATITGVSFKQFGNTYLKMITLVFVVGFLYGAMGLAGTGAFR